MILVAILNAVLAVLVVGVIVALHAAAILGDRPRRERLAPARVRRVDPIAPLPTRPEPIPAIARREEREEVAAGA